LVTYAKTHQDSAALLIGEGALPECKYITLANNPKEVAEHLYEALHRLDHLEHAQLLIELPPQTEAWAAINDRLSRATYQT